MEYRITVKPYVDFIHAWNVSLSSSDTKQQPNQQTKQVQKTYIGMMTPAEDYNTMILNQDASKTFLIRLPPNCDQLELEMYGYGKLGGTTEYSINDLISVSITEDMLRDPKKQWVTPIIVNTPFQIRGVTVELRPRLQEMTGLKQWIQLQHIPREDLKKQYNLQPSELAQRGIDITGKTWVASTIIEPPEWAFTEPDEYLRILQTQLPAQVHCFSLIGTTMVSVNKVAE